MPVSRHDPDISEFSELRRQIESQNPESAAEFAGKLAADPARISRLADADGRTLLHHAAIRDRADIARLLIGAGSDPSAQDRHGRNPASHSIFCNAHSVFDLLIETGFLNAQEFGASAEQGHYFPLACDAGNARAIEAMRSADPGFNPNQISLEECLGPFHIALASCEDEEFFRYLFSIGCDPFLKCLGMSARESAGEWAGPDEAALFAGFERDFAARQKAREEQAALRSGVPVPDAAPKPPKIGI